MEDAHTHLLAMPEDKETSFFAVFDGHGGPRIAQYAGAHLHKKIVQSKAFARGDIEQALREGFLDFDEEIVKDEQMKSETVGSTAVVVMLKDLKIYCANAGDSRAVISVRGLAAPLSHDHKPDNESERRRICAAGGWVVSNRVNGNLGLSRALGDFIYKRNDEKAPEEQMVTAHPDVMVRDFTDDDEFILLACDGIWDVLSSQEAVDFCRERLCDGQTPETVCEELLTRCLAPYATYTGIGCDNMTVLLVCLLRDRPWDEYRRMLARPRPDSPPPPTPAPLVSSTDSDQQRPETPPLGRPASADNDDESTKSDDDFVATTQQSDSAVAATDVRVS